MVLYSYSQPCEVKWLFQPVDNPVGWRRKVTWVRNTKFDISVFFRWRLVPFQSPPSPLAFSINLQLLGKQEALGLPCGERSRGHGKYCRIKYRFKRVTIQILDAALHTLETGKSRCQILGSQAAGYEENVNSGGNRNVLYPANGIFKFTMVFHICLTKVVLC